MEIRKQTSKALNPRIDIVGNPLFHFCLIYPRLGTKEADNPEAPMRTAKIQFLKSAFSSQRKGPLARQTTYRQYRCTLVKCHRKNCALPPHASKGLDFCSTCAVTRCPRSSNMVLSEKAMKGAEALTMAEGEGLHICGTSGGHMGSMDIDLYTPPPTFHCSGVRRGQGES